MINLMFYLHYENIEKSIQFYTALGFSTIKDDVDGSAVRRVRLSHPEAIGVQIALENRPELLKRSATIYTMERFPFEVAFTIITDNYLDWTEKFCALGVLPVFEVNEPWGTWVYYSDPSGNLLCISDRNLW